MTYCLSKTSMLLIGRPFALMPVSVIFSVLPSGDTARVRVSTNFPPWYRCR